MNRRRWRLLLFLVAVLVSSSVVAQERAKLVPPSAEELLADVRALTAPEMEGRGAGTPGGDLAGRYIADRLAAMGFRPGGDGGTYLQSFVLSVGTRAGAGTTFEILGNAVRTLALGSDWTPYGGSAADDASGGVVFVGYGMVVGERGYDDYAGVDVRGKIALALDGAPPRLSDVRPSRLEKLIAARRHGASALLVVTDPLPSLDATAASVHLVSGAITTSAADRLLEPSGKTVAGLRATLASASAPGSFAVGVSARIRVDLDKEDRHAANVVGILPGTDPARAGEVVMLGAHYDHLGRSGGVVHPGADDNASGTAVVLGIARALAAAGATPRTLVAVLFSGEEEGLIGSAYYARHPAIGVDRTIAMLNFDMVGRMRDRRLQVEGVESGTGLRELLKEAAAGEPVDLVLGDTPFAPSDHTSLYGAGAPVLFFYTGQHDDYHAPSDTADKINGVGIALVAKVALGVVERLQGAPRPAYVKLSPPRHAPRYSGAPGSAFLGIAVYGGDDSDGLRLASVMSGAAAERAGLHGGDVILRLDGHLIDSFAELRRVLAQKRPGDVVSAVYLRKGDDHATTITLDARP